MATMFGAVTVENGEIWFRIITFLFFLMTIAMGIAFLWLFVNKFNVGGLKIGTDFIEIPGRWKKRTKIKFSEIKNIGEINTYDHVIEIESENGFYLIEKQWMKSKEFDKVRESLMDQIKTPTNN
jgi:uncharacterized membrane protein